MLSSMIKRTVVLLGVLATAPGAVAAQGLGFGAFGGTLGIGPEAAVGITDRVVFRGGYGFMPFEPSLTVSDLKLKFNLPSSFHIGLDLYLNNTFRFGGGVLWRTEDPSVEGVFTTSQEIGGTTYSPSQIGTLTGVFDGRDRAPYVLLGFGRHTQPGIGLFLDLGVAFVGEPDITLDATGGSLSPDTDASFRSALNQEATDMEQDAGSYLKLWPFLSLGVRVGLSQN
jgi:hypothetical protein